MTTIKNSWGDSSTNVIQYIVCFWPTTCCAHVPRWWRDILGNQKVLRSHFESKIIVFQIQHQTHAALVSKLDIKYLARVRIQNYHWAANFCRLKWMLWQSWIIKRKLNELYSFELGIMYIIVYSSTSNFSWAPRQNSFTNRRKTKRKTLIFFPWFPLIPRFFPGPRPRHPRWHLAFRTLFAFFGLNIFQVSQVSQVSPLKIKTTVFVTKATLNGLV